MTSNSAKTKTLTIGETIYISTKAEWDLLFNDTSGGEYYKQLSSDYDGKNITIFLSSTPTDADFFETNKIILLETSNQSGKGIGKANLIGSGSADYQFLNCTIKGDVSNCNLAFNADISTGMTVEGFPNEVFVPVPVLSGKVKDCQVYFCPTYNTNTTGKNLRIGLNSFDDNNAILYKCHYGYNIQIKIENCMMLCRYISSSTALTNISITTDSNSSYSTTGESTGGTGNYKTSNVFCFYDINSINNLRFQDNIASANYWKLGHIWNLSNSYIYSKVAFNDRLKYVSSTDFSSMDLSGASEENKIDFDSCVCGAYPTWYESHGSINDRLNEVINNEIYKSTVSSGDSTKTTFSAVKIGDMNIISLYSKGDTLPESSEFDFHVNKKMYPTDSEGNYIFPIIEGYLRYGNNSYKTTITISPYMNSTMTKFTIVISQTATITGTNGITFMYT